MQPGMFEPLHSTICIMCYGRTSWPLIWTRTAPTVCENNAWKLCIDRSEGRNATTARSLFDSCNTPLVSFSLATHPTDPTELSQQVWTFLYQNFSRSWGEGREVLTPLCAEVFFVRFAPPATGLWRWTVISATSENSTVGRSRSCRLVVEPDDFV